MAGTTEPRTFLPSAALQTRFAILQLTHQLNVFQTAPRLGTRTGEELATMRTVKRKISALTALLLTLVLAACDTTKPSSTETGSAAQASAPTTTVASTEAPEGNTALPIVARSDIDADIIGEIRGEVDGNPFTVYVMISEVPDMDKPLASASWSVVGNGYRADILGYRESQTDRRGLITLHAYFDEELQFIAEESYAFYYESAFDIFMLPAGSITNAAAEWTADGVLAVTGSFSGVGTEAFTDNTREITGGEFSVDGIEMSML